MRPLRLRDLRERISSTSESGRRPAARRILVYFRHKFAPFRLLNDEYFTMFIVHQKKLSMIYL